MLSFVEPFGNAEQLEPLPGIAEMTVHFAGAMVRWASAGFPTVSEETFRERLGICQACDHWDAAKLRCRKCGCTRAKLHVATEECPIGKWSRDA